jgi:hypothetical protein
MSCALRIVGVAMPNDCMEAGKYIMEFDVGALASSANDPLIPMTTDPKIAAQFANAHEALAFWRIQSRVVPLRSDGKPNRPLTAYSVEICPVD